MQIKWSPIEIDVETEARADPREQCERIFQDAEEREKPENRDKSQEWWRQSIQVEFTTLLPFFKKYCGKYILKGQEDIAFVFFPKYLKGTFIVPVELLQ